MFIKHRAARAIFCDRCGYNQEFFLRGYILYPAQRPLKEYFVFIRGASYDINLLSFGADIRITDLYYGKVMIFCFQHDDIVCSVDIQQTLDLQQQVFHLYFYRSRIADTMIVCDDHPVFPYDESVCLIDLIAILVISVNNNNAALMFIKDTFPIGKAGLRKEAKEDKCHAYMKKGVLFSRCRLLMEKYWFHQTYFIILEVKVSKYGT